MNKVEFEGREEFVYCNQQFAEEELSSWTLLNFHIIVGII